MWEKSELRVLSILSKLFMLKCTVHIRMYLINLKFLSHVLGVIDINVAKREQIMNT